MKNTGFDNVEEFWGKVVLSEVVYQDDATIKSRGTSEIGEYQEATAFKSPHFDPETDPADHEWESEVKTWWNR